MHKNQVKCYTQDLGQMTYSLPIWLNFYLSCYVCFTSAVMANDFDGQIDYLEQFGSNSVSQPPHTRFK